MTNANDLLVEIAELILGAADLVAEQERALPALQPHPGGDSLGLTLLGYQVAMLLLPSGRDVWPRIIAPDPQAQLRAAERLTRQAPITDFPYGMVAVIATLGDEIADRTP
jgi:hypothetical protein